MEKPSKSHGCEPQKYIYRHTFGVKSGKTMQEKLKVKQAGNKR